MDAPLNLADIRREIDALDAKLRALLLKRADLVAEVAASKADSGETSVLRPEREAAQMAGLMAWQKEAAPHLPLAGVMAVWREIIGMAIAQQGGLTIFVTQDAYGEARAYFGASLSYRICGDAQAVLAAARQAQNDGVGAIGVLALSEAVAPLDGQGVFARLPLIGNATALCYGPTAGLPQENVTQLVWRDAALSGERLVGANGDGVLVETKARDADAVWGQYGVLEDVAGDET